MAILKVCIKCMRKGRYTLHPENNKCAQCLIKKAIKKSTEEAVKDLEKAEEE